MIDLQFMHCMGDDDLVVDAARVSFDRQADSFGPNQNESLINFLAREGHTAPFQPSTCNVPLHSTHFCGPTTGKISSRWNVE